MKSYLEFINENIDYRKVYEGPVEINRPFSFENGKIKHYNNYDVVGGDFTIMHPKYLLTSLEGVPKVIEGDFRVFLAELKNLEHSPKIVHGSLTVANCGLTSLEGITQDILGKSINANLNFITNLKGISPDFKKNIDLNGNILLTSLEGCPKIIKSLNVNGCSLETLENGPEEAEELYCINNKLTSLYGAPKGLLKIKFRENLNDLSTEAWFLLSGSYKNDYWSDLLSWIVINNKSIEDVKGWPNGFLDSNIGKNAKKIGKFNL